MSIGDFLVLLGVILAAIGVFLGFGGTRHGGYSGGVLGAAVLLIGLGVLVGANGFIHT